MARATTPTAFRTRDTSTESVVIVASPKNSQPRALLAKGCKRRAGLKKKMAQDASARRSAPALAAVRKNLQGRAADFQGLR